MKKLYFVVLAMLMLPACSRYSTNVETTYLKSRNGMKFAVPPPLTSSNISHFYDIPGPNQAARVSITPPVDVPVS